VTSPPLAVNGSSAYTIKLVNTAATPTAIHLHITDGGSCGAFYTTTAKVGSTDVSGLVANGTYSTPALAHNASTTVTFTIKLIATPSCFYGYEYWVAVARTPTITNGINLITNAAA